MRSCMNHHYLTTSHLLEYTMASFKSTIKSTLVATTEVVDAAAKSVSAVAIGADMLHEFMQAELEDQKLGYILNKGKRAAEQAIEAKKAIAQLQVDTVSFINKSAAHAGAYASAATYIDNIMAELGYENLPKINIS